VDRNRPRDRRWNSRCKRWPLNCTSCALQNVYCGVGTAYPEEITCSDSWLEIWDFVLFVYPVCIVRGGADFNDMPGSGQRGSFRTGCRGM